MGEKRGPGEGLGQKVKEAGIREQTGLEEDDLTEEDQLMMRAGGYYCYCSGQKGRSRSNRRRDPEQRNIFSIATGEGGVLSFLILVFGGLKSSSGFNREGTEVAGRNVLS